MGRDLGGAAQELEPATVNAVDRAEIAEQHGVLPRLDEGFELTPQAHEAGWTDVHDEHAVLDTVTVGLEPLGNTRPTGIVADVVCDQVAAGRLGGHRVRMPT